MNETLYRERIIAKSAVTIEARISTEDRTIAVPDDVLAITVNVFDLADERQIGDSYTPDVASVITDELETWDKDSTGKNFTCLLDAAYFPDGDTTYRVEVFIHFAGDYTSFIAYDLEAERILSSLDEGS